MQKTLTNQNIQAIASPVIQEEKLTLDRILKFYNNKSAQNLIGLEYERLSLDKLTYKSTSQEVLAKILKMFSKIANWELKFDNNSIVGAISKEGSSISLEPGKQLEISLSPKKDIIEIDLELNKINNLIQNISNAYNVSFIGYGINPSEKAEEIELLNKTRYQIMDKYLPNCLKGELSQRMMRQTAGIQINIDYFSQKDAYLKLKFFNLIMPFMSAFCANSPYDYSGLNKIKSIRTNVWRFTGKNRCNLFYEEIFTQGFYKEKNLFKNYIKSILKVPMIFIERDNKAISINGKINFETFMQDGYCGYNATFKDYLLHQSLVFPDVRLKKYIEIRNHDSNNIPFALALCALYKGLSLSNFDELIKMFDFLNIKDVDFYNEATIKEGLNFKVKNKIDGWLIIRNLLDVSCQNLNSKERSYLEPISVMIEKRKTNSDLIQDNKINNTEKLVQFLTNVS